MLDDDDVALSVRIVNVKEINSLGDFKEKWSFYLLKSIYIIEKHSSFVIFSCLSQEAST